MTWKELVNFVEAHKDNIDSQSDVTFLSKTIRGIKFRIEKIVIYADNNCEKCDHKHQSVDFIEELKK